MYIDLAKRGSREKRKRGKRKTRGNILQALHVGRGKGRKEGKAFQLVSGSEKRGGGKGDLGKKREKKRDLALLPARKGGRGEKKAEIF